MVIEAPFHQWGLDFIDPINTPSNKEKFYILIAIDYFSKWVEAELTTKTSSEVVCEFLKEYILVRFGVSMKLIMDNASYFSSLK